MYIKNIEHIKNNENKGVGVRLIKNGTWSFCSITNPNWIHLMR